MGKRVMQVKLEQVAFYAYHGLYPVEVKTGGQFLVNLSVSYPIHNPVDSSIISLPESVDYVSLYQIVQERMSKPTPLLETVVMDIVSAICSSFSQITCIDIQLVKVNPPIPGFQGNTSVQYRWEI
jgi:dihydroneopterin aldolase